MFVTQTLLPLTPNLHQLAAGNNLNRLDIFYVLTYCRSTSGKAHRTSSHSTHVRTVHLASSDWSQWAAFTWWARKQKGVVALIFCRTLEKHPQNNLLCWGQKHRVLQLLHKTTCWNCNSRVPWVFFVLPTPESKRFARYAHFWVVGRCSGGVFCRLKIPSESKWGCSQMEVILPVYNWRFRRATWSGRAAFPLSRRTATILHLPFRGGAIDNLEVPPDRADDPFTGLEEGERAN